MWARECLLVLSVLLIPNTVWSGAADQFKGHKDKDAKAKSPSRGLNVRLGLIPSLVERLSLRTLERKG